MIGWYIDGKHIPHQKPSRFPRIFRTQTEQAKKSPAEWRGSLRLFAGACLEAHACTQVPLRTVEAERAGFRVQLTERRRRRVVLRVRVEQVGDTTDQLDILVQVVGYFYVNEELSTDFELRTGTVAGVLPFAVVVSATEVTEVTLLVAPRDAALDVRQQVFDSFYAT